MHQKPGPEPVTCILTSSSGDSELAGRHSCRDQVHHRSALLSTPEAFSSALHRQLLVRRSYWGDWVSLMETAPLLLMLCLYNCCGAMFDCQTLGLMENSEVGKNSRCFLGFCCFSLFPTCHWHEIQPVCLESNSAYFFSLNVQKSFFLCVGGNLLLEASKPWLHYEQKCSQRLSPLASFSQTNK